MRDAAARWAGVSPSAWRIVPRARRQLRFQEASRLSDTCKLSPGGKRRGELCMSRSPNLEESMHQRISTRLQVRVLARQLGCTKSRRSLIPGDRGSMADEPIHSGRFVSLVPELLIAVFCFLGMTIFLHG